MGNDVIMDILEKVKYHEQKAEEHRNIATRMYNQIISNLVDLNDRNIKKSSIVTKAMYKTLDEICSIFDVARSDVLSGSRKMKYVLIKRVFTLIAIHRHGYIHFDMIFSYIKGFRRSNISHFLNQKQWMWDTELKRYLKEAMEAIELQELSINFSDRFRNEKIRIDDL